MPAAYLDRLRRFAAAIQPDAEALDSDPGALAAAYSRFVADGLHTGGGAREPLSGPDFCESLAILGQVSGAFGFLALQQLVANGMIAAVPADAPWPVVGVAFGHLRNPRGPAPRWDGAAASGPVPWLTGASIFPQVVLGMRGAHDEEVFAVLDAHHRAEFLLGAPLALVAGSATGTVRAELRDCPVDPSRVLRTDAPGSLARTDALTVLFQTPLMVGCVRACLGLIRDSARVGAAEKHACDRAASNLLCRVVRAFDGAAPEEGVRLRAELYDFGVRLARLAAMASGGAGLVRDHPAQRLYREALLYSLMAQTDAIVEQAFRQVFE